MNLTALNATATSSSGKSTKSASQSAAETQDRFLKLLVAQMKHQDPLNPLDNAQVTSQMAQIQQVTSLATLDTSIKGLGAQLGQLQALQSVGLVGREVNVPGDRMIVRGGQAAGSFSLDSAANGVKLEVLSAAGGVIDTVALGAQGQGLQSFKWPAGTKAADGAELRFRITANQGASPVPGTTFSRDKVAAVFSNNGALKLNLERLGPVDYTSVVSVD